MTHFYASIIFIGIVLIVITLLWVVLDRKKEQDSKKDLEQKKEQLVGIIADAEQMIDEMNRFSDYIVTQMDLKHEELNANLRAIEERIKFLSKQAEKTFDVKSVVSGRVVNGGLRGHSFKPLQMSNLSSDLVIDNIDCGNVFHSHTDNTKLLARSKDKVIPINSRHNEVVQLAQRGLSVTEIARQLNMGKGEIQLILGMNK